MPDDASSLMLPSSPIFPSNDMNMILLLRAPKDVVLLVIMSALVRWGAYEDGDSIPKQNMGIVHDLPSWRE